MAAGRRTQIQSFLSDVVEKTGRLGKGQLLVVTPSAGNDFVTVYDYVSGKSVFQDLVTFSNDDASCASLAYKLA